MRRPVRPVLLALVVALLAACGGDGNDTAVPSNSVAVVGDTTISKAEFDNLINYAKRSYETQNRDFPKVGTPEYVQLRDQAMRFLIQRTQFEVKAAELDIEVNDAAVDKRVDHKVQRQVDPFIIYGIDAAGQAIEDAGLLDMSDEQRLRAGCSTRSPPT